MTFNINIISFIYENHSSPKYKYIYLNAACGLKHLIFAVYLIGLLSVPHLRDRFRTVTNVLGDSIGAGIVEHLSRHELQQKDPELCSSVVEEPPKKSYHLVCQENECDNQAHPDSETKM